MTGARESDAYQSALVRTKRYLKKQRFAEETVEEHRFFARAAKIISEEHPAILNISGRREYLQAYYRAMTLPTLVMGPMPYEMLASTNMLELKSVDDITFDLVQSCTLSLGAGVDGEP